LFKVDHFGHQQVIHVLGPGVTSATVHLCRCNALDTHFISTSQQSRLLAMGLSL